MKRAERIYRWLLHLYPRDFRDEYGQEMASYFRERTSGGTGAIWLQILHDLVAHAPREHWLVMKQDLRYAIRSLLRAPTFAATIIVTLALGIGANAVVFSAIDAVLLRDAAVSDPASLVDVYTTSGDNPHSRSSYPDYFDLRDSGAFESLAAYTQVSLALDTGVPEPVDGQLVSGNFFDTLGVRMPLGRGFAPDEDVSGAPVHVAVISQALWRRTFDRNPSVIGRSVRINGGAYTIIGVAPADFGGPQPGISADVWLPTALQPEVDPPSASVRRARGHADISNLRSSRGLLLVGRLPADTGIDQVAARTAVVATQLQAAYPDTNRDRRFTLTPLGEGQGLRVDTRPVLQLLAALVALVLAVACVNVAGLMLSRAVSREREVALRVAIGASRPRLVRQWLTESAVLGVLGSLGALIVAWLATPLLHAFVIPEAVDLSLNGRVFAFTLAVGLGSGLLFGLAPILHILRRDTIASIRAEGTTIATSARAARMRGSFVVLQVALSLVLLVGAGLLLRSLGNAYAVDLGFQVDRVVVVPLNLEARGFFEGGARGAEAGMATYERVLAGIEAVPGVVAASAARVTVLSGSARSTGVSLDGRPVTQDGDNTLGVRANVVSHRYFEALNIPIIRGRSFDTSDVRGTPRVVVVTRSLAERIWPGADPIGRSLIDPIGASLVVGVVPDTIYTNSIERDPPPTYYLALAQNYESAVALHVRASGDPLLLVPAIRNVVQQIDNQLALGRPRLLADVLDQSLGRQRMMATTVGLFGALALVLAMLGLYGVMAHSAVERTPEIGIRLALGARPRSIVQLLLRQGVVLLGIGGVIGLVVAAVGTRLVEAQLFAVSATDPLTFAAGTAVLALAGLTASIVPALRAMRVDPITALRRR